jgi:hypothetical protein
LVVDIFCVYLVCYLTRKAALVCGFSLFLFFILLFAAQADKFVNILRLY